MQAPAPVRQHPNATFVLSTTPITSLIVWGALQLGLVIPQAVAAAIGTIIPGVLLVFRGAIQNAAGAVWTLGIVGCCRRVWRGDQQT